MLRHNAHRQWLEGLGFLLVALAACCTVALAIVPLLLSWHPVVVRGASMEPAIRLGAVELVDTGPVGPVHVGDILVFRSPAVGGSLVTHRVVAVSIDGRLLTTKGDANAASDEVPVATESVIGRYRGSVPFLGYAILWTSGRRGLSLLVLLPGLAIVTAELNELARTLRSHRGSVV